MHLHFRLQGLPPGQYRVTRDRLDRSHGSSFDQWLTPQAPSSPGPEEITYLLQRAEPAQRMEIFMKAEEGYLSLDMELQPLEMELICLERTG